MSIEQGIRATAKTWRSYWFTPSTAESLGLARIVCFFACFAIYLRLDDRGWTQISPVFWMPISVFRLLPGPPHDPIVIGVLQAIWKLSLITSALGLLTRFSLIVAAVLGFFLLGLPNCFGKIHHLDGFPVLLLLIFALSRCGDAFALDRVLWRRRNMSAEPSGEYTWPVRLGQALFLLIFFAAGFSKIRHSGFAWMTADNMRFLLLGNLFIHEPWTRLGTLIVQSDALCFFGAVATVAVELSALLALFFQRLRFPFLFGIFGMQTCITLFLGIYFTPHLIGYLLFFSWERIHRRLRISLINSPTGQLRVGDLMKTCKQSFQRIRADRLTGRQGN